MSKHHPRRSYTPHHDALGHHLMRVAVTLPGDVSTDDFAALAGRPGLRIGNALCHLCSAYGHLLVRVRPGVYQATEEARRLYTPLRGPAIVRYIKDRSEGRLEPYRPMPFSGRKRRLTVAGCEAYGYRILRHNQRGWGLELDGEPITTPEGYPVWWPGIEEVTRAALRISRARASAQSSEGRATP